MSALPHFSDVDLLGYGERVINLEFRDSGPCSRSSCGLAGVEPLEDSLFSYRST